MTCHVLRARIRVRCPLPAKVDSAPVRVVRVLLVVPLVADPVVRVLQVVLQAVDLVVRVQAAVVSIVVRAPVVADSVAVPVALALVVHPVVHLVVPVPRLVAAATLQAHSVAVAARTRRSARAIARSGRNSTISSPRCSVESRFHSVAVQRSDFRVVHH